MASTNKTPHLGLCQWEATDPFLREDMNGDFAKIDAAVTARIRRELLKDITLTPQNTKQIDVDVSDIDFSAYMFVILIVESMNRSKLLLNGKYGGYSYSMLNGASSLGSLFVLESGYHVLFHPFWNDKTSIAALAKKDSTLFCGYSSETTYRNLKTLRFLVDNDESVHYSPTRLKLWGVG